METPGSQFLHERNPNLHTSQEVEGAVDYLRANGDRIPNEPAQKIETYIGFLANKEYVNDGILTGNQESIERQIEAHIVKAEDVPESYFALQRRILREQGHGDIEVTDTMRDQLIEAVQSDQRSGLAKWVEYLGGDDGSYPDWFKYYTWNSITKLGNYDKEKGEFLKRSKGTTAPYPELNREALAYVFDSVNKSKIQGEKVDGGVNDERLQKLLQSANFGKLYAHAVLELKPATPEQKKLIEGSWTKYEQSADPRTARRLASSLQGHGTGWCTAGESTAEVQLKNGDFYVYYTRDEDNKDTIPRVAIRMQNDIVAEVRGINPGQELEPELTDIALERLKNLPGGEEYNKKADNMKRLTAIDKKITENPEAELTKEEITFIYEINDYIKGFGYERDPRIHEIKSQRDIFRDMAAVFNAEPTDKQAVIKAMLFADKNKKFRNPESILDAVALSENLPLEIAEMLYDAKCAYIVVDCLSKFRGLNDKMARNLMINIKGIDLPSFEGLSEDTFYRLVDEFYLTKKILKHEEKNTIWELLKNADRFILPDHQRIADTLMDKRHWSVAARLTEFFDDIDTSKIAERMIAEGQLPYISSNLENFPSVNHQELAELLLDKDPSRLAIDLERFNIDKNVYVRKLIEAGQIGYLATYFRTNESLDKELAGQLEAERKAQIERSRAYQEREEQMQRKMEEDWAEDERLRQELGDDYYA